MRRPAVLAAISIGALLALSVATFAATRAVRARDDLVNTVVVQRKVPAEGTARISFVLARPDRRTDVLIVSERGAPVRSLARAADLDAGAHTFRWDGTGDHGEMVDPGRYRLRVVLGEEDREIDPPGIVRVRDRSR